jgi:hypothetical protein
MLYRSPICCRFYARRARRQKTASRLPVRSARRPVRQSLPLSTRTGLFMLPREVSKSPNRPVIYIVLCIMRIRFTTLILKLNFVLFISCHYYLLDYWKSLRITYIIIIIIYVSYARTRVTLYNIYIYINW